MYSHTPLSIRHLQDSHPSSRNSKPLLLLLLLRVPLILPLLFLFLFLLLNLWSLSY
ncbi:MAG: hypothetical protein K6253_03185 [Candidatus Liberibacter asiaticus]|nr:hypothetical protein [Candidatus Liberibacter asiaticus]